MEIKEWYDVWLIYRRTYDKKIKAACDKHIEMYKKDALAFARNLNTMSQEEIDNRYLLIQQKYYETVAEDIIMQYVDTKVIKSYAQVKEMCTTQDLPGFEGSAELIKRAMTAGMFFLICYSGYTQKPVSTQTASMLSHYQGNLMEKALHEVDQML